MQVCGKKPSDNTQECREMLISLESLVLCIDVVSGIMTLFPFMIVKYGIPTDILIIKLTEERIARMIVDESLIITFIGLQNFCCFDCFNIDQQ